MWGGAYACFQEVFANPLGYFLPSKSFSNTLSASLLQAPLFYSLTSYFHLNMDCLILFVLPRVSCITRISLFLQKIRFFFFPVIVFSCPVWRSCRQIFHITSFMGYFWGKNISLRVSNRTQPTDFHGC